MEINIVNQSGEARWNRYRKDFEKIGENTKKKLSLQDDLCVSVIFVSAQTIQELNRKYRQMDRATDVISFALCDAKDPYENPEEGCELGDIFINVEAIVVQAKAYDHSMRREVCFLFIHGLLHLLGYNHRTTEEEKVMFDLQDVMLNDIVSKKISS